MGGGSIGRPLPVDGHRTSAAGLRAISVPAETCSIIIVHTLLFRHFERRYTYFLPVTPLIEECLLVPFYVRGKAVGTIWAIMHDDCRKFDAEDERLMSVLGQFASLAYQTLASINDLKFQIAEREKAETALHELASGLEAKIRHWSTPTSSASSSGMSKVGSLRPMKPFYGWWDTAAKISYQVA
jgi:transcriptional regulator with GAF, ATPase, and Fis domain